jgi:hypothetical protein
MFIYVFCLTEKGVTMNNENIYKHAGFALVAAAIAFSTGSAHASDQASWVWKDRGDHRVAVAAPAPDVVYRSAPYRVVISRPAVTRIVYTRPAVRQIVYARPVMGKVVYPRPTLFPSKRTIRVYAAPPVAYLPVSTTYVQNIGYLAYR